MSNKSSDLCRFKESLELLNKLEVKPIFFATAKEVSSVFENAGLSDDEAQHLCELAYSVLETKKLYFSGSEIEVIGDCVHYSIYIDLPIEDIFDVNWELAGVFVDNVEDRRNDALIFEYKSVDILEERLANECIV